MNDIVIVGAVRTAIGKFGGNLSKVPPLDLGKHIIKEVLLRSSVQPEWVDKVIFGCNFAPLEQNLARDAALLAGVPIEAPGFTINSTCGASMQAAICAIQSIACGETNLVIAGGVESMSNAPYILKTARWGQRMRHLEGLDLLWKGMQEPASGVGMGLTAENLAEKYSISREDQDAFALLSHQRAARAIREGKFLDEITPVAIPVRKGTPSIFQTDEHVKSDVTMEGLAKLPPIFKKDGTVTAGNTCGMNDAAAAAVLVEKGKALEWGLEPLARIKGYHVAGVDPNFMGIGPVPSIRAALKKAAMTLDDIDRFEINEAFAAQYLACESELNLDRKKVNVHGNGIALGHPVGATGARLLTTLLHGMINDDLNTGVFSLCAGGGMGFSVILERI